MGPCIPDPQRADPKHGMRPSGSRAWRNPIARLTISPTGPEPARTGDDCAGPRPARNAFATKVVDREPADSLLKLGRDQGHVFYFSEVHGMQDGTVTHRWEHDGRIVAEIPFSIGGSALACLLAQEPGNAPAR